MEEYIDPVCKMKVSKDTKYKTVYKGKVYYFCCDHCKSEFEKNPEKYIKS